MQHVEAGPQPGCAVPRWTRGQHEKAPSSSPSTSTWARLADRTYQTARGWRLALLRSTSCEQTPSSRRSSIGSLVTIRHGQHRREAPKSRARVITADGATEDELRRDLDVLIGAQERRLIRQRTQPTRWPDATSPLPSRERGMRQLLRASERRAFAKSADALASPSQRSAGSLSATARPAVNNKSAT